MTDILTTAQGRRRLRLTWSKSKPRPTHMDNVAAKPDSTGSEQECVAWKPLGHGAFYQGIVYEDHAVDVDLFQAATGDANGDRQVNFADLWQIFVLSGKYETDQPATWAEGDIDENGTIGFGDLWATFVESGLYGTGIYTDLPDTKGVAVPETGTLVLLAAGLISFLLWRRRRDG